MQADLAELGDALLGRLGFQLPGSPDVGDQGDVHGDGVLGALLQGELADRLQEGQPLDVPGSAADFGDENVGFLLLGQGADVVLDLVGDVGDDLHGLAQVIAAPLLLEHQLVNLAAGDVVGAGKHAAGEPLVMAEVEIGLSPVIEDVNFPVLERVHRARIHVQIRVELEHAHLQPAMLQQRSQRGGGKAFA